MSSSVQGTTSVLLEGDTPAETYNVAVVCDISPSSTADYCEAIARNDANTVSGNYKKHVYKLYMRTYVCTGISIFMTTEINFYISCFALYVACTYIVCGQS